MANLDGILRLVEGRAQHSLHRDEVMHHGHRRNLIRGAGQISSVAATARHVCWITAWVLLAGENSGPAGVFPGDNANHKSRLVSPADLLYRGVFKLPPTNGWQSHATWDYANGALAYYPDGDAGGAADGYPGSLFVAGHVHKSRVAEVSIPPPVRTKDPAKLNTSSFLQPLTDILSAITNRQGFIMGMTYLPAAHAEESGHFYVCHSTDYGSSTDPQPGLGRFAADLSRPKTAGFWFLGNEAVWNTTRYILEVPKPWADLHAPGMLLACGRHRNSWGNTEGPNLFTFTPPADPSPPPPQARLDSYRTLMRFHPNKSKEFVESDTYQGAAWITRGSRSAVIIAGIKDLDLTKAYYGYENWTKPDWHNPNATYPGPRGWRCGDGRASLLFFDPDDLAGVINGSKQPGEPRWYARLDINDLLFHPIQPTYLSTGAEAESLCITYDRQRSFLYLAESFAIANQPVIHVFQVSEPGAK